MSTPPAHPVRPPLVSGTAREAVVARLAELSDGWLPPLPEHQPLGEALAQRTLRWNTLPMQPTKASASILYPLVHADTARVTAQQFCEITDAACEARRIDGEMILAGIPVGRARLPDDTTERVRLRRIAEAWQRRGFPVRAAGMVHTLPGAATRLVERARRSAFRRRALDLVDLLAAAAADALGTRRVYLAAHVQARRNLGELECVSPLCQLYLPDPFADPPSQAKLRPAGSDALWFLAFTLGPVETTGISDARRDIRQQVKASVAGIWNDLRAQGLTAHRALTPGAEDLELRVTRLRDQADAISEASVVAPLFGAPTIAESTRRFLAALTTVVAPARLTLCVDDLTPRFLYRGGGGERAVYRSMAADLGCDLRLLSDLEPAELTDRIDDTLARLRGADLVRAVPPGILTRVRGRLTGYDAVHLAVMATCLEAGPKPGLIAAKGANYAALQRLARFTPATGSVVCTGHEQGPVRDTPRLVVEDAALLPALNIQKARC